MQGLEPWTHGLKGREHRTQAVESQGDTNGPVNACTNACTSEPDQVHVGASDLLVQVAAALAQLPPTEQARLAEILAGLCKHADGQES